MELIDTVICYITWAVQTVVSYAVDAVEFMLMVLISAANLALSILPTAALDTPNVEASLIGKINYFIPLPELMLEFSVVMFAWIVYRILQYFLRWAKADY
jgi:hypothetical protein